jgi:ESCRT-I complex subunit VPS37
MDSPSVSLLQHLNTEELKELLNDQGTKIEEMTKDLPQIKALESEREMLIASNKSLAEYNLSKEPTYRQTRQMLLDAHKEALEQRREIDRKRDKLNELSRQTSLDTTLALMQTMSAEAEEESEKIAETFLSSEISLEVFLAEFLEKRKLSHLRRIKTEKMMEYIRSQNHQQNFNEQQQGPVRPAPPPPTAGGLPYPIAHGMPQPQYNNGQSFPFSRPFP